MDVVDFELSAHNVCDCLRHFHVDADNLAVRHKLIRLKLRVGGNNQRTVVTLDIRRGLIRAGALGVVTDVVGNDLIERTVFPQRFQSRIDLVNQFGIALCGADCIILLDELLVQNFQPRRIFDKCLGRLFVNDNTVQLAGFQRLNRVRALLEAFDGSAGFLLLGGDDIAGGADLYADLGSIQISGTFHLGRIFLFCTCGRARTGIL